MEVIAVLGVVASAIQIIKSCAKIIKRIRKHRSTGAFPDLETQLLLLSRTIDDPKSATFQDEPLVQMLQGCKRQLEIIYCLIQSLKPAGNSKFQQAMHTGRANRRNTDKRIREAMSILSNYKLTITLRLSYFTYISSNEVCSAIA